MKKERKAETGREEEGRLLFLSLRPLCDFCASAVKEPQSSQTIRRKVIHLCLNKTLAQDDINTLPRNLPARQGQPHAAQRYLSY